MSEAIRLLHALAQALSTMALYSPGHPATQRSIEAAWQALAALLRVDDRPVFFFIGTAPVYSGRALHELRDWPYVRRFTEAGVHRLEFDAAATETSMADFFSQLMVRLTSSPGGEDWTEKPIPGIIFGRVAVEDAADAPEEPAAEQVEAQLHLPAVDLTEEVEAMGYVLDQGRRGRVARAEVEAIARILSGLLEHHEVPQLSFSDDFARYPRVHPINTALLSIAAARAVGVDPAGCHRVGVAAMFLDIGMTQLPEGLGSLSSLAPEQRVLIETHTQAGARLLLDTGGRGLELAATVAYEHHLRPDGAGYPQRRFQPAPHWASRLIGTAAALVALSAPRGYRPAWSAERALTSLEEGAGTAFDAEAAHLILGLVRPG